MEMDCASTLWTDLSHRDLEDRLTWRESGYACGSCPAGRSRIEILRVFVNGRKVAEESTDERNLYWASNYGDGRRREVLRAGNRL